MQHKKMQDMIIEGRKKLVKEKKLSTTALARTVQPANAYDEKVDDWRYLAAAWLMQ